MNPISIMLYFAEDSRPELIRTEFRDSSRQLTRVCVRGKSSDQGEQFGSFQWTSAVRAMCAVFLRFLISDREELHGYCLQGGRGSLASSLDYALSKNPTWLLEMFGAEAQGAPYARRLFRLSNPNRKRPGPVIISVNNQILEDNCVGIVVDDILVSDRQHLRRLLDSIETAERGRPESSTPIELVRVTLQ